MYLFFESIKLNNGSFCRLKYHQKRVNEAFKQYFPDDEPVNLMEELNRFLIPQEGIYKCRIVYSDELQSVEFVPYMRRDIKSLKLVETTIESLKYKSEDRSAYVLAFEKRAECDDVLLVRNGLLTDTSYSNIALFDGIKWYTPRLPLLYGTNRAELIETGKIEEKDITVAELKSYQKIALFNAMIEFGEIILETSQIQS